MNNAIRKINVFLVMLLVVLILVGGFLLMPASAPPPPILLTNPPSATKLPTQVIFQEPANTVIIPPPDETNIPPTLSGLQLTPVPLPTQLTPSNDLTKLPTAASMSAESASPSPVAVQQAYLPDGMYLTISGSTLPTTYRLGPLAKGAYTLGPNDLFMAYVTNDGQVFALRLSTGYFAHVANLKWILSASLKNVDPYYRLSFYDAGFVMFLIIYEDGFGETNPVWLPRWITY